MRRTELCLVRLHIRLPWDICVSGRCVRLPAWRRCTGWRFAETCLSPSTTRTRLPRRRQVSTSYYEVLLQHHHVSQSTFPRFIVIARNTCISGDFCCVVFLYIRFYDSRRGNEVLSRGGWNYFGVPTGEVLFYLCKWCKF